MKNKGLTKGKNGNNSMQLKLLELILWLGEFMNVKGWENFTHYIKLIDNVYIAYFITTDIFIFQLQVFYVDMMILHLTPPSFKLHLL